MRISRRESLRKPLLNIRYKKIELNIRQVRHRLRAEETVYPTLKFWQYEIMDCWTFESVSGLVSSVVVVV